MVWIHFDHPLESPDGVAIHQIQMRQANVVLGFYIIGFFRQGTAKIINRTHPLTFLTGIDQAHAEVGFGHFSLVFFRISKGFSGSAKLVLDEIHMPQPTMGWGIFFVCLQRLLKQNLRAVYFPSFECLITQQIERVRGRRIRQNWCNCPEYPKNQGECNASDMPAKFRRTHDKSPVYLLCQWSRGSFFAVKRASPFVGHPHLPIIHLQSGHITCAHIAVRSSHYSELCIAHARY